MTSERIERRKRRSQDFAEALTCLLEATCRRARLKSLVLSDRAGLVVAGVGPSSECDELAAWAPLVVERGATAGNAPELFALRVPPLDAYLCTASAGYAHTAALSEAAEGCARILAPLAASRKTRAVEAAVAP
ncbi:MAG TPA: hypothetical protein VKY73_13605 [Polyangiaceae bacterium]|nr:hypothetical protein [Polyangiaceae bacterium]